MPARRSAFWEVKGLRVWGCGCRVEGSGDVEEVVGSRGRDLEDVEEAIDRVDRAF